MSRAVFLDRDGTLIEEAGYLDRLDRVAFFPFTVDAVRLLNRAGFMVVVVTNQAGIGRGFFDEAFVEEAHRTLSERLAAGGAAIDAFYFCPHHPEATRPGYKQACDCRKPQPGLLKRAAHDHDLDLAASFVVGDRGTISPRALPSARAACSCEPATARAPRIMVPPQSPTT